MVAGVITDMNKQCYQLINGGQCSWFEFASKVFELLGLRPDFGPTTSTRDGAKVQWLTYSVLDSRQFGHLEYSPTWVWEAALQDYFDDRALEVTS